MNSLGSGAGGVAGGADGSFNGKSNANIEYKSAYLEKVAQCRNLEKEVMELKRGHLETERRLADAQELKHIAELNHTQQVTKNNYNKFESEIMRKQIQSLVDSLCKSENTIGLLMKEKHLISTLPFFIHPCLRCLPPA